MYKINLLCILNYNFSSFTLIHKDSHANTLPTKTTAKKKKNPTIPCKECKQCNKQNHGKFLHSFTVSASSAVLMALPMFHLYNSEAKGRSFRALHLKLGE